MMGVPVTKDGFGFGVLVELGVSLWGNAYRSDFGVGACAPGIRKSLATQSFKPKLSSKLITAKLSRFAGI
jgi:hypothetical protein